MRVITVFIICVSLITSLSLVAQINNYRAPGTKGLNVFETKKDTVDYKSDGIKVKVGGDFALQFQSLRHTTGGADTLANLGSNFNLPTANMNLDVQLYDGLRMSMVLYLSSRHHAEAWVKGGYVQVDKLDFVKEGFLEGFMKMATIKVGLDEINYGDAHFRRSDNARALYNPFVGNYIMDAFTTEMFGELNIQKGPVVVVLGVSNGNLNQSVVVGDKDLTMSYYGKLGMDKQVNDDLRVRLTGSLFYTGGYDNGKYLYSGDRTGARYYHVMEEQNSSDDFRSGRFNPGFIKYTSFQINPFVKWKGVELFGVFEQVSGDKNETTVSGKYTQIGSELLYRMGKEEKFYLGARYNSVSGIDEEDSDIKSISRINIGGGWFITDNVGLKAEYVTQSYSGNGWLGTVYERGNFKGVVLEAVIGF